MPLQLVINETDLMAVADLQRNSVVTPNRRSILVVDDETHILDSVGVWLSNAGYRAILAADVREALKVSRDPSLVMALIDYRLPSGDDGIRLGRAIRSRRGLPFVLISGYLNTGVVFTAAKAGAVDVIDKPLTESRLVAAIRQLRLPVNHSESPERMVPPSNGSEPVTNEVRPPTVRWARFVLKACSANDDPRRVPDWAQAIGTSEGTIDETCRLCSVTSRDSRDLARFLRAIFLTRSTKAPLWTHLAVADERTLNALFQRAGLSRFARDVTLQEYFVRQAFVPTSRPCLRELAHLAANSPLFFRIDY